MDLILLKNFNNYFDRIIYNLKDIDEYTKLTEYKVMPNINFMLSDDLMTEQVFNFKENWKPNYLLVCENNRILSKWFVLEWKLIRGHQYNAKLKRDIIAENLDTLKTVPMFIEKGTVSKDSPLIFNSEGMTYNQIKTKETLLKDKTNISWLVGYIQQRDFLSTGTDPKPEDRVVNAKFSRIEGIEPAIDIKDVPQQIKINFNENEHHRTYAGAKYEFKLASYSELQFPPLMELVKDAEFSSIIDVINVTHTEPTIRYAYIDDVFYALKKFIYIGEGETQQVALLPLFKKLVSNWKYTYDDIYRKLFIEGEDKAFILPKQLAKYENAIVEDKDTKKKYVLKFTQIFEEETKPVNMNSPEGPEILNTIKKVFNEVNIYDYPNVIARFTNKAPCYEVRAVPFVEADDNLTTTIKNIRNHCNDAPYDFFCIPFDKNNTKQPTIQIGPERFDLNNGLSLAMARGIVTQLGGTGTSGTSVYDVQLLPYCPIKEVKEALMTIDGKDIYNLSSAGFTAGKDYSIIERVGETQNTPVSVMFWGTKSEGSFTIDFKWNKTKDAISKKVENETTFLRLCSPNYSGVFEFSPTKNDGIEFFKVDYTLKPFNPYIHIAPNFGGLYGKDFNDSRGLICGGDFSIATLTDAWARYELNNKNYQQMFDREIKNMDVNNSIAYNSKKEEGIINAFTSTIAGGVGGFLAGGPIGAGVGAGAMAIGSGVGLSRDLEYMKMGMAENRQFKVDMFNYSLGNIKALPQGLAKTTPFTFNNKVFPFVEVYTATEKEKEALKNKLAYNGMTVMVIGVIGEYIVPKALTFIKGQLIRGRTIEEEPHVINEIFEELNKGVYIYE